MTENPAPTDLPLDQTLTLPAMPDLTGGGPITIGRALAAVDDCLARGQPGDAERILRHLQQAAPDSKSLKLMLANLYVDHGQPNQALPLVNEILDSEPERLDALAGKAKALYRLNRSAEAVRLGERIRELDGEDADNLNNLGVYRMTTGDFAGAGEAYRAALSIRPDFVQACHNLMRLPDARLDTAQRETLERIGTGRGEDGGRRILALLCLGTHYRHEGNVEREFEHLHAANRMLASARPWDQAEFIRCVDEITALRREDVLAHQSERHTQVTPVFIASMPRAGSTLVEQLLSTHPDIGSIGEAGLASIAAQAVVARHQPDQSNWWRWLVRDDANELFAAARLAFDRTLAGLLPTTALVSEKSINNDIMLGLCLLAFPRAIAIHCRRHPLDVCLSAYQTYLPQLEYTHSLRWLATRYEQHERLLAHWSRLFPGRIVSVEYESLVDDPETEIGRLFDAVGVGLPDGGIRLEQRDYVVKSASNWQVRQPVYQTSRHRWRRYAAQLDEIMYLAGRTAD